MGLIKAAMGAVGGALADQWREFFYCDALDQDVLVVKGRSASAAAPPTPREMTISSPTVRASQWRTGSA